MVKKCWKYSTYVIIIRNEVICTIINFMAEADKMYYKESKICEFYVKDSK